MAADLLEQMRGNPAGDWSIGDVERVCRAHGLLFRAGKGTSHCHAKHPTAVEILTIRPGGLSSQSTSASCALY
jgi:hypothetical protein